MDESGSVCGSMCARIRDAVKTQLRVVVVIFLMCALWLVIYFAALSHNTRERFKDTVAPLNTDAGVWLGAFIQAVFSVLAPVWLNTDDDLPGKECGVCCRAKKKDPNNTIELIELEIYLDDDTLASTDHEINVLQIKDPVSTVSSRKSVTLFLLWKTAAFTLTLAILTYYVRWFYQLQDRHFGAVHDEVTGEMRWDVLFKKILVDEYLFTPTNVLPVVTIFLFTRLIGRQCFLGGTNATVQRDMNDEDAVLTCSAIVFSWLIWVIPHYILCLMTWFPSHLMIYPMPSGVQLPLFMCVVILSNVLQSYMTMNSGGNGGSDKKDERRLEKFPKWASAKAKQWFGTRG